MISENESMSHIAIIMQLDHCTFLCENTSTD